VTPLNKKPRPSALPPIRLVVVESPFKATQERSIEQHKEYLKHCLADCAKRGESPYASHLMLTEVLDDDDPHERGFGIKAGWEWAKHADAVVCYEDFGISPGMRESLAHYEHIGKPIERRTLDFALIRSIMDL
jgi:hypothetical protein